MGSPDRDDAFLALISGAPDDDIVRLVYADWLSDNGEPEAFDRAAFLRAQAAGADLQQTPPLDPSWLARVDRTRIDNCGHDLRHHCPRQWQELLPRSRDGRVRFCAECNLEVFHCATLDEAREHAQQGRCVAVSSRVERRAGDLG